MKIIVFENDSEFDEFAVDPSVRVIKDGDREYFDWSFTNDYNTEVAAGTLFFIKDRKSKVLRRNACTSGIISKPVSNVKPYSRILAECSNPDISVVSYSDYINENI